MGVGLNLRHGAVHDISFAPSPFRAGKFMHVPLKSRIVIAPPKKTGAIGAPEVFMKDDEDKL